MREMSAWSIAASIFFSVALASSANEAAGSVVSLAGAGNPAAVEQGLAGFVARMGGSGVAMPGAVATASGHAVTPKAADLARLEREKNWVVAQGSTGNISSTLSGLFGLTDGRSGAAVKGLEWDDDNDKSIHFCDLVTDKNYMIIAYKPADGSFAINWLTDVNGKIYSTAYTDATGIRVVPNADHAAEFAAQLSYWDNITPAGTTVARNGSGS